MDAKPVRVAYLISKYPEVTFTFILREVVALRERGFEIETAAINAGPAHGTLTQTEQSEAARTFYIKAQGVTGVATASAWLLFRRPAQLLSGLRRAISLGAPDPARILLCLFYLLEAAILARWMEQRGLKHVHVHLASQAATVALLATYLAPMTLSITVHGPDEFYDVPGSFLSAKMARAHFVACISFFAQSQVMKVSSGKDWQKFEVSRLGVDTAHFLPRPFPPAKQCFEVLCVARLAATKGQRILIAALESLTRSGRSVHLTLVGDGPDRADLERMVREKGLADQVTFAGSVNQDHIRAFYAAADIFALASFAEGIPVVLMEAMAIEIPCIATTINGIPELIRDGVDGLLVSPSDRDGLVCAINRLIDDPELRRTLGAAGRVRVQQAYELTPNIGRLAEVFRSRLSQAQPAE